MKHPWLLLIGATLLTSCSDPAKSASDHARDTAALEKLFPVLEADRVTALRRQDGCRVIAYRRGEFGHSAHGGPPKPATRAVMGFDSTADTDLDRIWKQVEATKTGVFMMSDIAFDASGRASHGVFDCSEGVVRQRYVFEPGHTLPADIPNERWHTAIDSDWYYVREDWN